MLTDNIKTATRQYHQETEKILIGKLKTMRSVNDYINILKLFYGYFGGLEQQIDKHINATNLKDHHERRKTAALANDLEALGNMLPTKATSNQLPVIENELQAFGALYVIEGSTLGGQIISKMVRQHLDIKNDSSLSFFNGYGEDTGKKWARFQQMLNTVAASDEDQKVVIAAANDTFSKFRDWMMS